MATDGRLWPTWRSAHPGIVEIVEAARAYLGKEISLLMGGFHLSDQSDPDLRARLQSLRSMGVRKVARSHCTGDRATILFRDLWGTDFVEGGCGAVIEVP